MVVNLCTRLLRGQTEGHNNIIMLVKTDSVDSNTLGLNIRSRRDTKRCYVVAPCVLFLSHCVRSDLGCR